jgi:hypothetical protein
MVQLALPGLPLLNLFFSHLPLDGLPLLYPVGWEPIAPGQQRLDNMEHFCVGRWWDAHHMESTTGCA